MFRMISLCMMLCCCNGLALAEKVENRWAASYALEANGHYEQAAALMVPEMSSGEASEFALLRYGWLNYLQGNYNDAIRAYGRALKRNQRSVDARLGIALPLLAQQRWREARKYLLQVLDQSPYDYTAHIRLMICEEGLRQWKQLQVHAQNIAAHYPTDTTVLIYLARAYAWQGVTEKAKSAYRRVLIRNTLNIEATRFLAK
ncbi:MAG: tetratricopeptide repeat protein [Mariprofundaceae bacterium]|nr:tetratricopeptide repeat protein [Mariprofundaceae bacterium]